MCIIFYCLRCHEHRGSVRRNGHWRFYRDQAEIEPAFLRQDDLVAWLPVAGIERSGICAWLY